MSVLIEVDSLTKSFGPFIAVDDINFSLKRGEVLGFLGPNGAGKTTTMRMITGFLFPTKGKISVCGHDVSENPIAIKEKIGYVPEGAPLYGEMTVMNFLRFIQVLLLHNHLYQRHKADHQTNHIYYLYRKVKKD